MLSADFGGARSRFLIAKSRHWFSANAATRIALFNHHALNCFSGPSIDMAVEPDEIIEHPEEEFIFWPSKEFCVGKIESGKRDRLRRGIVSSSDAHV